MSCLPLPALERMSTMPEIKEKQENEECDEEND